ncbi:MAG: transposase [Anaerolineae bacterium]|nr:transposase [Anaerolineae bacterium]
MCEQKDGIEVIELNVQVDHVHLVVSIPPKYAVFQFMGYLKGKLALRLLTGTVMKIGKDTGPASMAVRGEYCWQDSSPKALTRKSTGRKSRTA